MLTLIGNKSVQETSRLHIDPSREACRAQILHNVPPRSPLDMYLFECELKGLRPDTIILYRKILGNLRNHIGPLFEADQDALMSWYVKHARRASRTRTTYGSTVQLFYKWAVERELISRSPATMLPVPRLTKGTPRPITLEDLQIAYENADERVSTWLTLGAYAGLRAGEMARLRREEVHDRDKPPRIEVRNGKGGKDRTVIVGQTIVDTMRDRRRGNLYEVTPHRLTVVMSTFFRDLEMPWTAHSLRHFYGTYLYQLSGGDIRFVQEQMGHSSPTTTAIYAQYASENAVRTVAALDGIMLPQIAA